MDMDTYFCKLQHIQAQVDALEAQAGVSGALRREVVPETFAELRSMLAELQANGDELRRQHEELLATRQEIEDERQRYYERFTLAPDAYLITDSQGIIQEANQAAALLLNHTPHLLKGIPLAQFIPRAERRAFRARLARLCQGGRLQDWEARLQPPKQPPLDVALSAAMPQHGTHPGGAAFWLVRDITRRKQLEADLLTRTRQQAAVAELGRQAVAISDLTTLMEATVLLVTRTLNVEHARILELLPDGAGLLLRAGIGWRAEDVGRLIVGAGADSLAGYTFVANEPMIVENLGAETRFHPPSMLVEAGIVSCITVIIHGREGPFGVLGAETIALRIFNGNDIYFLQAVANVLTAAIERRAVEDQLARQRHEAEQLAELDQLRRSFIATISHNLRTPLTALQSGLGMLEASSHERLHPAEHKLLENARRSIERLAVNINDLLTAQQLEAGILQVECAPLDLRSVAVDALTEVHPLFQEKTQVVEVELSEPLPVEGDQRYLIQVIVNLLDNAHRHTPPGTHITIQGWNNDREVRISVSDTGPGIPQAEHESIFQRFHRLDVAAGGSGLGLAIARSLVERHNGRLLVESAPGEGATFLVALPRARSAS